MKTLQSRTPPSLARHLTAMLYDSLLVIALVFVVNAIALGVVVKLSNGSQETVHPLLVWTLTIVCIVGFYTTFWLTSGQTLGMQAWRIKLERTDGGKPGFKQAVLRCTGAALSLACLGLGYLWRLLDHNKRYWHDYLSGTELILMPKGEKNAH